MAKYYVQSGRARVVFDAENATEAAVRAFQWSCDKQAGIEAERLSVAVTQDGEPRHLSLYAVPGYLEAGDARLAALIEDPVDDVYVLGGFANPVQRDADTD